MNEDKLKKMADELGITVHHLMNLIGMIKQ
jgi:hypothetical protein